MRHRIVLTAFLMLRSGSAVSAAATATISTPPKAKITTSSADATPLTPWGMKSLPSRFPHPGEAAGVNPSRKAAPSTRKTTTKVILISENQNSNSPKLPTLTRLIPVKTTMMISAKPHCGKPGMSVLR